MKQEVFYANNICATGKLGAELKHLSLSLFSGEILGLFGNRYAGKGALFEIMAGGKRPLSGVVEWDGAAENPRPNVARVLKHSAIVDQLEIWENIILLWDRDVAGNLLNSARQKRMIKLYLEDYGLSFDLNRKAGTLSQLEKVLIECLMALRHKVRILIVDLNGIEGSAQEYNALKTLLDRIRDENVAVMVSCHQTEIISLLSDRIAVIFDGRIIKEFAGDAVTPSELEALAQRLYQVETQQPSKNGGSRDRVLQVSNLDAGLGKGVSFSLYKGELAGIVSPQGELFQILRRRVVDGEQKETCSVLYKNTPLGKIENGDGIYFLDAKYLGDLIDDLTPLENLCLGVADKIGLAGFENKYAIQCIERDFYEWYGHEGLLRQKDSRALYKKHRVAISLFRLRFLKADVIFCNALNVHSDVVSYRMAEDALIALAQTGTSVCMLSNDIAYQDDMIERHVVLGAQEG